MSDAKFLEIKDLVIEYTSGKNVIHAVNGVSLSLERGETLGLVGETGAGKTTIAQSIIGILPVPPSHVRGGEILLDGKDLLKCTEDEMLSVRGEKISMIFQDPMTALNPIMTVGDQIMEVILLHNQITKSAARDRACEMLETVGIPRERYEEFPFQFSGGMKQRVVIAMALACNPELLLADEPTTALDVTIQAQVLEMIKELQERLNTSMILITHDLGVVAETCDKVAVIYMGRIVESGTREDIFKHASHPYTKGLFGAIPKLNDKSKRLSTIGGMLPDPSDLPKGCHFAPRCKYATKECSEMDPPVVEISQGHFCRCCHIEGRREE